jgi:hypothetical protein
MVLLNAKESLCVLCASAVNTVYMNQYDNRYFIDSGRGYG